MPTVSDSGRAWIVLFAVACQPALAQAVQREGEASLKQRLYDEAPGKWADYTLRAKNVQGTISYDSTATVGDVRYIATFQIKRNAHAELEIAIHKRTKAGKVDLDSGDVQAANPAYWFKLRR